MRYVVLISHGEFAPGLQTAVEMMVGQREDLLSTSLKNGESTEDFKNKLMNLLSVIKHEDEIILMCDILGGSPLTTSLEVLSNQQFLDNTLVITGMNMPLAITAMTMKDNVDSLLELKDILLFEGKESVSHFEVNLESDMDDEEI